MSHRILVPVDGSELTEWILRRSEGVLRAPDTAVKLLHVVESPERRAADLAYRSDLRHLAAHAMLFGHVGALRRRGIEAEAELAFGDPAAEILRAVAADRPTVLVMATNTRRGWDRVQVGGVAQAVLRSSPAPVMFFKPPLRADGTLAPSVPLHPAKFQRILVPLDGSPEAEEVVAHAVAWATPVQAHLLLFKAVAPTESMRELVGAGRYLESWQKHLASAGLLVETHVRYGAPVPEARAVMAERGVDAIAMTTHGRGRIGKFLYGSVAEQLLDAADGPVLMLRNRDLREPLPQPRPETRKVKVSEYV